MFLQLDFFEESMFQKMPRIDPCSAAKTFLGSSGIKFEVEGGRGPRELIHTYPLQKSFNLASFFTEICDFAAFSENFKKWLHFGKIPKKFGENLKFQKNGI